MAIPPHKNGAALLPCIHQDFPAFAENGEAQLSFYYRKNKATENLVYPIIVSEDLVTWTPVQTVEIYVSDNDDAWLIEARFSAELRKSKFIKLQVSDSG